MRRLLVVLLLALLPVQTWAQNVRPIYDDVGVNANRPVSTTNRFPVEATEKISIGSTTWTKTSVTLTGASQNLLAANAGRKGFIVYNRAANAQIDIDVSGGVVAANTGRAVSAGADYYFVGAVTPVGAITVIGTAAQVVTVWEGT